MTASPVPRPPHNTGRDPHPDTHISGEVARPKQRTARCIISLFGLPVEVVWRPRDWPFRLILKRRRRSAAAAARSELLPVGNGPSPWLTCSLRLCARVSSTSSRSWRRRAIALAASGWVLSVAPMASRGVQSWCLRARPCTSGSNVGGAEWMWLARRAAGGSDVELSVVGAVIDDHVGFVDGGSLGPVDRRRVVDGDVGGR